MQIRRREFFTLASASAVGSGASVILSGCEGLDYSARGEGTGVQVIGAIVVLARYHASQRQKAVAESKGHAVFVQAAEPEYKKRRTAIRTNSQTKIASAEKEYTKKVDSARSAHAQVVKSAGHKA